MIITKTSDATQSNCNTLACEASDASIAWKVCNAMRPARANAVSAANAASPGIHKANALGNGSTAGVVSPTEDVNTST